MRGIQAPQQLPLQLSQPPRTARHRPAPAGTRRESPALYAAVLALRHAGRDVYRCGALHRVSGRLLTSQQLVTLARHAAGETRHDG